MEKIVQPNYSVGFKCIADKCSDSCCRGWEIVVDSDTAQKYEYLEGDTGDLIRSNIFSDESGTHISLIGDDRCPFLKENGLCELILREGEGILCEICREHPRFYTVFPDRTEMGYGLCCEEACRLLLEWKTGIKTVGFAEEGAESAP